MIRSVINLGRNSTMFCGAPVKSLDDITRLRRTGFDFGEIGIANAGARRMWTL